ncbi:MAG: hypothetical protein HOP11_06100 [Saprospiraceae bacterium]|nr:hypothetical protein [Saprospiraceae bacterium]
MKNIFLFIILPCLVHTISAQCGAGNILLTSQSDVDNFSVNYPGCHRIMGDIEIQGDGIENLDGLSVIDTVDRGLTIKACKDLYNIYGLKNLVIVQDFIIRNCPLIEDLMGLQSFQTASNSLGLYELELKNLVGLNRVKYIRQFAIVDCKKLQNIGGIDSLKNISTLSVSGNPILQNLEGLRKDVEISQFYLEGNANLNSLTTLDLEELYSLDVRNNAELTDLSGLSNLKKIWFLNIVRNDKLLNLNSFVNLRTINNHLRIVENSNLSNISGLKNFDSKTPDSIMILKNPSLGTCHIESICEFLKDPISNARIENNASECIDRKKVEENCIKTGINNNSTNNDVVYFYASNNLLNFKNLRNGSSILFFDINGRNLYSYKATASELELNVSEFNSGIFFIRIDGKFVGKIIK